MPTPADESRFHTSRLTLLVDWLMTRLITVGGVAIIGAVCGIMVFLVWSILPLFRPARLEVLPAVQAEPMVAMGLDDWGVLAAAVRPEGRIDFLPLPQRPGVQGQAGQARLPLATDEQVLCGGFDPATRQLTVGTTHGRVLLAGLGFPTTHQESGTVVAGTLEAVQACVLGPAPVQAVDALVGTEGGLVAAVVGGRVVLQPLTMQTLGLGRKKLVPGPIVDLGGRLAGSPLQVLVAERGEAVVVRWEDRLGYFFHQDGSWQFRQAFNPFDDQPGRRVQRLDWLVGRVSLVVCADDGQARLCSLYREPGFEVRRFGRTKDFPRLPEATQAFAASLRNKVFLRVGGGTVSLTHGTTAAERQRFPAPARAVEAGFNGKADRLLLRSADGWIRIWSYEDPHPEAEWATFFGRLWYEGSAEPAYTWQSSASTDDVEPKLSLVPLIVGTLKATLYALLVAIPIALLGALYTAEFLPPHLKAVVKPVIELMASLPSVVLGFLGALWLAPRIEDRIPSLILVVLVLPVTALLLGWGWTRMGHCVRRLVPTGHEFLAALPVLALAAWLAWLAGPLLESWWFTVHDPGTGRMVADFRSWWVQTTGLRFDQRNAVVVGVMMGFAVIPLIFTIAEDALANVPRTLRSASLALGASRWQTAVRVVLPTASAGIFSAVMIGLGRAIGETMIVVMATGNTPILGLNPFDGMRTLSANIAKEMPEAAADSTLFRTLFLSALLLFGLTFLVNTIAELARQHLRQKYQTI